MNQETIQLEEVDQVRITVIMDNMIDVLMAGNKVTQRYSLAADAFEHAQPLAQHGFSAPDVIVSGIPFSTMTMPIGRDILRSVYDALDLGGAFVAYQVRDRVHTLGSEVFGRARVQTELLNVPPMRIYRWVKTAAPASRTVSF